MVRVCLNLNELHLSATRLEDRIVFTLLKWTMYSYNCSLYNVHAPFDYENEGGMLRKVVSKMEHLQAAFGGFKVLEEVPFFSGELVEEWFGTNPNAAVPKNPLVLYPIAAALNCNSKLWSLYNVGILSSMNLKVENDDRQGSALICDTSCIQTISKRQALEA
ncbi:hypothetical protein K1719_038828 [Acacia pycnantha]|nr:hypothetical protein K1719_038828 [Acacia pycnantha]